MIWRAAGICGIDPGPFTLRELLGMQEGRLRAEWDQVSALMAHVANLACGTKERPCPYPPDFFHPWRPKPPESPRIMLKPSEFARLRFGPPAQSGRKA